MTLPVSGYYNNTMLSFFGTMDSADQQSIWKAFLQDYGYTTNPSASDPVAQAAFQKAHQEIQKLVNRLQTERGRRKTVAAYWDALAEVQQKIRNRTATGCPKCMRWRGSSTGSWCCVSSIKRTFSRLWSAG